MPYFTIELLSDLCVSNGESFGSRIDTDISYDTFGIPIIKAKSLKGCLREVSEELEDIKAVPDGFTDKVFGCFGDVLPSSLIIQNAHPTNYSELICDVQSNKLSQNVVRECYTYTRVQTSIDGQTGTAKKGTLRNKRVLSRGLTFVCEYTVGKEEEKDFLKCITALRYIGMNRTRGLGAVKCRPLQSDKISFSENSEKSKFKENEYIEYALHTISPIIPSENCKTEYIPAASVIGLCFNRLGRDNMLKVLDSKTIFTNAYVSDGKNQFFSAPAFLAKQKDSDMSVYLFDTPAFEKADLSAYEIKTLKKTNIYISPDFSELKSISIKKEINYHHKQSQINPGTVEIGNFYQLNSFSAQQCFIGRIYGNPEILDMISNSLSGETYHNIGYYRSSGYGQCKIRISKKSKEFSSKKETDIIAVWLKSPVIIYDDYGMACVKPQVFADYFNTVLQKEIGASLSVKDDLYEIPKTYLNYTNLDGYNNTWGMNKPVIRAFESGSVFVFKLDKKADISLMDFLFVGERTNEGYGEIAVFDYNDIISQAEKGLKFSKTSTALTIQNSDNQNLYFCLDENKWELPTAKANKKKQQNIAAEAALKNYHRLMSIYSLNSSTLGRLMLMLKECKTYQEFLHEVGSIKDKKKYEKITHWIDLGYNGISISSESWRDYLDNLFTLAKYALRG